MKHLFFILCLALSMTSCKSYIQIYDVQSKLPSEETLYTLENDECKATFNFWGELGSASVAFYNKTDQNMYIPLKKSTFVFNGLSLPMYEDATSQTFFDKNIIRTVRTQPVACVAPHSYTIIYSKTLVDRSYSFCDPKKDFPKRSYSETFSEEESPVKFDYYICYSYNPEGKNETMISAKFYVSKIENKTFKKATHESTVQNCDNYHVSEVYVVDGQSPMRFYIQKKGQKFDSNTGYYEYGN